MTFYAPMYAQTPEPEPEPQNVCGDCIHYIGHYTRHEYNGRSLFHKLESGHCTTPRLKNKKSSDKACAHYEWDKDKITGQIKRGHTP
jgi:hypothetical protein